MASEIRNERLPYGARLKKRGYAQPRDTTIKARDRRPGMSPAHLGSIRDLPCCVCGDGPRSDPHHLKAGTGERGMGLRSTDRYAVPLCRHHHRAVEKAGTRNERGWFQGFGINALALANALWAARGDIARMRRIVEANRG